MDINEVKNLSTNAGIYIFTNMVNNKHYIGQAVNLRKRIKAHIKALKCPEKHTCLLYPAIIKYGIENFKFEIIEELDPTVNNLKDTLDNLEKFYIKEYNSYGEYNKTVGGDYGVLGLKMTPEQKEKIKVSVQKRVTDGRFTVLIYNLKTKEYSSYINMKEASEKLGYKDNTLRSSKCHKRILDHTYIIGSTKEEIEEILKNKENKQPYNIEEYYKYISSISQTL